jgi:hypothetical protein
VHRFLLSFPLPCKQGSYSSTLIVPIMLSDIGWKATASTRVEGLPARRQQQRTPEGSPPSQRAIEVCDALACKTRQQLSSHLLQ